MTTDPAVIAMMDAVFAEYRAAHPPAVNAGHDADLWRDLDDLGLVRLTGDEAAGGSGAGWHAAAELLTAAARHGVRIPLAEHDLLACWLLEANTLPVDAAVRTVAVLDAHGTAVDVPWASTADHIVLVWPDGDDYLVADTVPAALRITPGTNMIGEPRDTVSTELSTLIGVPIPAELVDRLWLKSALVRSIQVCAALDRSLELSIDHVTARTQFGRPLARFQAVQHLIADIAAEAALARAATEAALSAAVNSGWSATNLEFRIAVARSCAGHAASVVTRNAHQALGAIGTTREHRLPEFTRAALAWRAEFGSVRYWDSSVADAAARAGAAGLWELICD